MPSSRSTKKAHVLRVLEKARDGGGRLLYTRDEVAQLLGAFVDVLVEELIEKGEVTVFDMGAFHLVGHKAATFSRNLPGMAGKVKVLPRVTVRFAPTKTFNQNLTKAYRERAALGKFPESLSKSVLFSSELASWENPNLFSPEEVSTPQQPQETGGLSHVRDQKAGSSGPDRRRRPASQERDSGRGPERKNRRASRSRAPEAGSEREP